MSIKVCDVLTNWKWSRVLVLIHLMKGGGYWFHSNKSIDRLWSLLDLLLHLCKLTLASYFFRHKTEFIRDNIEATSSRQKSRFSYIKEFIICQPPTALFIISDCDQCSRKSTDSPPLTDGCLFKQLHNHHVFFHNPTKLYTKLSFATDHSPLIAVFQINWRMRCQIRTVHPGCCFHACCLSGSNHVIHYLWQKTQRIYTFEVFAATFITGKTEQDERILRIHLLFHGMESHTFHISKGIRKRMQIDCLTEIKLLASN